MRHWPLSALSEQEALTQGEPRDVPLVVISIFVWHLFLHLFLDWVSIPVQLKAPTHLTPNYSWSPCRGSGSILKISCQTWGYFHEVHEFILGMHLVDFSGL